MLMYPQPQPQEPNKNKTKNMHKKKKREKNASLLYSSTQFINIINIMLNYLQLKLVKFTKNEQNRNKKTLQAHHVTTKTGQKKQQ